MVDAKYTASPEARPLRFVDISESLMTSGRFSDVKIICGTRTWMLHRVILTTRCLWFDKALNGEFKVWPILVSYKA
ncbi:hypothetical protein F4809DRAFT_636933 [Biscogniauxia mediterranea]|nr:hypothetical protein F4809DRAFT_636933 [Biscogniauxia mediterranea]